MDSLLRKFVRDLDKGFPKAAKSGAHGDAALLVQALEKSLLGSDHDPRELPGQMVGGFENNHPLIQGVRDFNIDYRYLFPDSSMGNNGRTKRMRQFAKCWWDTWTCSMICNA